MKEPGYPVVYGQNSVTSMHEYPLGGSLDRYKTRTRTTSQYVNESIWSEFCTYLYYFALQREFIVPTFDIVPIPKQGLMVKFLVLTKTNIQGIPQFAQKAWESSSIFCGSCRHNLHLLCFPRRWFLTSLLTSFAESALLLDTFLLRTFLLVPEMPKFLKWIPLQCRQ